MSGPFKQSRLAVAFDIGTEGSFSAGNVAEADSKVPVYEPSLDPVVEQHDRNPSRGRIGHLASVPGARYGRLTFGVDLRGSGTGGVAPKFDALLRACGLTKTTAAGSAVVGAAVADTKNLSSVAIAPASGGTFAGTKSGTLTIVLDALVTDTSATFRWYFQPADGTLGEMTTTTHTDATTETPSGTTYLDGVTWQTTLDPNTSTSGWRIGDRWTVRLTSDQEATVTYRDSASSHECLDIALYRIDNTGAYAYAALHSARGTFKTSWELGAPAKLDFVFMGVLNSPSAVWVDGSGWTNGGAYDTTVPPAFLASAATRGGSAVNCFRQIGFDLGAQVTMRDCALEASGYKAADIVSHRPTLSWDPQGVLVATDPIYTRMLAGTQSAFVATLGATAGNAITLRIPKYQETGISQGVRNGLIVDQVQARCSEPEYDAGADYDQFELEFA